MCVKRGGGGVDAMVADEACAKGLLSASSFKRSGNALYSVSPVPLVSPSSQTASQQVILVVLLPRLKSVTSNKSSKSH